jgi:2-polyprenyl-3-methyl-5-hydroxy-6-metoxy-1,4-benzoquinol methylase
MKAINWYKHQVKNSLLTTLRLLKNAFNRKKVEDFANFQKNYYEKESANMSIDDHKNHNFNPNLWLIGYGPLILYKERFKDSNCLDFACGTGRNMTNLAKFSLFREIHGADISQNNLDSAKLKHESLNLQPKNVFKYHQVDGKSVMLNNNTQFHFIFSTIAFQHIPVHKTRLLILRDLVSALHDDGIISFQMGFGGKKFGGFNRTASVGYYKNYTSAKATNGASDTRVEFPNQIKEDLQSLGLPHIKFFITEVWDDKHPFWIWIWGSKKPFTFDNFDQVCKNL